MIVQQITELTETSVALDKHKHIQLPERDIRKVMMLALSVRNDLTKGKRTKQFGSLQLPLKKVNFLINHLETFLEQKEADTYLFSSFTFCISLRLLKHSDFNQQLTQLETEILIHFCENQSRLIDRETLLKKVWGHSDFYTSRSLDVYIHRLRKYFKIDSTIKLETVHRKGFRFSIKPNETLSFIQT